MNTDEQFAIKTEANYQPINLSMTLDTALIANNPS
jgi:hypothetical protein